jgi:uncharacterized repeat protein (TIGR03803 family)
VPFCPDSNGSLQGGPVGGWQKRADWAGHTFGRGHWISDHVGRRERSGSGTVLHAFNGADGIRPDAGAILDASGNVYGTTSGGGGSRCDCGTVFKLSHGTNGKWTRTVRHRFNGMDGANLPARFPTRREICTPRRGLAATPKTPATRTAVSYSSYHLERMARGRRLCCMSSMARTGLSFMLD